MSTKRHSDENAVNYGVNRHAAERLHQCLHQIAELDERSAASVVVDAIRQALPEAVAREVVRRLQEAGPR